MSAPDENRLPDKAADDGYYNPVFERLMSATNSSAVGAIAYALYKTSKRQWVQDFTKTNTKRPTDADYRNYAATQTDAALNAYIAQAKQILGDYAQDVIKDVRPRIRDEALKGSFGRSFWPSFVASAAFAAVLLLFVVIAAVFGFGLPVQITLPRAGG